MFFFQSGRGDTTFWFKKICIWKECGERGAANTVRSPANPGGCRFPSYDHHNPQRFFNTSPIHPNSIFFLLIVLSDDFTMKSFYIHGGGDRVNKRNAPPLSPGVLFVLSDTPYLLNDFFSSEKDDGEGISKVFYPQIGIQRNLPLILFQDHFGTYFFSPRGNKNEEKHTKCAFWVYSALAPAHRASIYISLFHLFSEHLRSAHLRPPLPASLPQPASPAAPGPVQASL